MRRVVLFGWVILSCSFASVVSAKNKKDRSSAKKKKPVLVTAIEQGRMLEGDTETPPEPRFILVWKDKVEPGGFFWHGKLYTWPCELRQIKNYDRKTFSYDITTPAPKTTNAGDTLEITLVKGSKHPTPTEVREDRENVLYYKNSAGLWMAIPVTSFELLAPASVEPAPFRISK